MHIIKKEMSKNDFMTYCLDSTKQSYFYCIDDLLPEQNGQIHIYQLPQMNAFKYAFLETQVAQLQLPTEFTPNLRLIFCLEGETHLQIEQQEIILKANGQNSAALLPIYKTVYGCKLFHYGKHRELVLFFDNNWLNENLSTHLDSPSHLPHLKPQYFQINPLMQQLILSLLQNHTTEYEWQKIYHQSQCISLLMEVLQQLFFSNKFIHNDKNQSKRMKKLIQLLHNDSAYELSIADLAAACYSNPTTLQNDFKKYYHTSIARYLRNLKLERAKLLLMEGCNITQAALVVGYSNTESFSKAFKQLYGKTPSQLIKQNT